MERNSSDVAMLAYDEKEESEVKVREIEMKGKYSDRAIRERDKRLRGLCTKHQRCRPNHLPLLTDSGYRAFPFSSQSRSRARPHYKPSLEPLTLVVDLGATVVSLVAQYRGLPGLLCSMRTSRSLKSGTALCARSKFFEDTKEKKGGRMTRRLS